MTKELMTKREAVQAFWESCGMMLEEGNPKHNRSVWRDYLDTLKTEELISFDNWLNWKVCGARNNIKFK